MTPSTAKCYSIAQSALRAQTCVGNMVRLVDGRIVPDVDEGSSLCGTCTDRSVNILGFQIRPHWAAVVALLTFLLFHLSGLIVLGMIAAISHFVSTDNRSSGGGGRQRRHEGLRSNVRGIDDIPRPARRS